METIIIKTQNQYIQKYQRGNFENIRWGKANSWVLCVGNYLYTRHSSHRYAVFITCVIKQMYEENQSWF